MMLLAWSNQYIKQPHLTYMARTSKKAGRAASKVLRSQSTGKNSKRAAASALRQRRDRH